ncbi:MAG: DUF2017 family protein, partial [Verrucomicrobia bacterium]|nr:DUF2017 family protein [Verrucomicrobiota bacterium]
MIYRASDSQDGIVLAELEPFFIRLLAQIPACADPGVHPAARARLFASPSDEPGENMLREDWRELVEPELAHLFITAQETVATDLKALPLSESLGAEGGPGDYLPGTVALTIPQPHYEAWLSTLNQARLVLAARHGIGEREMAPDLSALPSERRSRALLHMFFHEVAGQALLTPPASAKERALLAMC